MRNATISTRIAGLTWLVPVCAEGTNVFQACASAAGRRATMPIVMINEMPLPIPRSVIDRLTTLKRVCPRSE